jgi:hypothetical protein
MIKILAKPWVGEFGWELFGWQAYLRTIAKSNELIVCVKKGKEALYQDFAHKIILCNFDTSDENLYMGNVTNYDDSHYNEHPEQYKHQLLIDPLDPFSYFFVPPTFISYGIASQEKKYDILYHARTTTKLATGIRNWSTKKWEELLSKFSGKSVAAIGTQDESEHIAGDDLRGIPLSELVDFLSSSTVLIGPSSGPMHLGALCGIPQVVWTQSVYAPAIKGTNKDRYETIWNPFNIDVQVIEQNDWDPSVETVYDKTQLFILKAGQNENLARSSIHESVLDKYMAS